MTDDTIFNLLIFFVCSVLAWWFLHFVWRFSV